MSHQFFIYALNFTVRIFNKSRRENLKSSPAPLPEIVTLLIHQSIYSSHPNFCFCGGRRLKMSNKPTNIDLTKWRGVTFTNNSLKMDVFLINGASVPMASRPLGPIGKPAIFQNKPSTQKPQKLKPIQSKRNFSRNRTGSVKGNRKSQVSK